jgi:hypothetical protein
MKKHWPILFIALLTLTIIGCTKNPEANQNNSASSGKSATANTNSTPQTGGDAKSNTTPQNVNEKPQPQTTQPTLPQASLAGTYAISEVQHDGIVEIIGSDNTTEITFKPPASFSRVSKKKGVVDHTDSGQYKIEGDNKLTLKIVMSKERIQAIPVEKFYGFILSSDGAEMKLVTVKDKKFRTAVFRRIKQLPN